MVHSETDFNQRASSSALIIELAHRKPETVPQPVVEDALTQIELPATPDRAPDAHVSRKTLRGLMQAIPGAELRDRIVERLDPERTLKPIVMQAMADIREAVRDSSGDDPEDVVKHYSIDPGITQDEIRFLNDYVALAQRELSIQPRHRKSYERTQPVEVHALMEEKASEKRKLVPSDYSASAQFIVKAINTAIDAGEHIVQGQSFINFFLANKIFIPSNEISGLERDVRAL